MKVLSNAEDPRLVLGHTLNSISPLPRCLHSRLYSLRARVHEEDHFEPSELSNEFGEGPKGRGVEGAGGECELGSLGYEGGDDGWVTMSLIYGAVDRSLVAAT